MKLYILLVCYHNIDKDLLLQAYYIRTLCEYKDLVTILLTMLKEM